MRAKIYWGITLVIFFLIAVVSAIGIVKYYEPSQWQAEQQAKDQGETKAIEILASERVAYYTNILAIFTGVLSGFGLLQIIFLIRADNTARITAEASQKSSESIKIQERVLIYGGPGINLFRDNGDGTQTIIGKGITIGNYGRSPGYLEKLTWGLHEFEGWNGKRTMDHEVVLRDFLYPHSPAMGRCHIELPFEKGETLAFNGRIYFRDIYGQKWYTTWEHRLEAKESWNSYPLEHNAELHKAR